MNYGGSYDAIKLELNCKEKQIDFKYLTPDGINTRGGFERQYFKHNIGNKDISFVYNPHNQRLTVDKMILPYYLRGHNFNVTLKEEKEGIEYLSYLLNVDLFESEVSYFEHGTILEIPFDTKSLLSSHVKISKMKSSIFTDGKFFDDSVQQHRMYDAGKNIKRKVSKSLREQIERLYGFDPTKTYLKAENRYYKPQLAFKQRIITLGKLFEPDFIIQCNQKLIETYQSIVKRGDVQIIGSKNPSFAEICIMVSMRNESLTDENTFDAIHKMIDSMKDRLNTSDRDSRKAQNRKAKQRLTATHCKYDISGLLQKALFLDNEIKTIAVN